LGTELTEVLQAIEKDQPYGGKEKEILKIGVHTLPKFPKDSTDRNRTSPFAFTGNKFEFRMLGSFSSVSCTNVVLNTAVAEELKQFADTLESAGDFEESLHELIKKTITEHKRIIFNGNGYDDAWIAEAEKRGLLNLRSTPECLPYSVHEKNLKLFTSHKVYSETEMRARYEILSENYCKTINIEALTMIDMAKKDILPAVSKYSHELSDTIIAKAACGDVDSTYEKELLAKISKLNATAYKKVQKLEEATLKAKEIDDTTELSMFYKDSVFAAMSELRITVDELETMVPAASWPYPSYGDMLFSVK
ncbi:MAG: glutamine synthetase type III, partial [Clostridia bacterium]|nr:glutamine synthetase type III [Clostridia bacterium]